MALSRHLVAAHIRSVGGPSYAFPPPLAACRVRSDRRARLPQGSQRPPHDVLRTDRQAGPPGHAKTRRMRIAPMNDTFQGTRFLRAVGMTLALALLVWVPAFTQQPVEVSGTVTSTVGGRPVSGVTVRVRGSNTSTVTDAQGKYTVAVPPDAVLVFSLIGYRGSAQTVAGRSSVNVTLEPAISVLPDVVVTGYQTQLRKDFTGAASSVNTASVEKQTATSVLQRLDGRVAGVTIDAGGSPGSRTTVRIRGVTSFQNNDPLYIIDGTPTLDSYLNWVNNGE